MNRILVAGATGQLGAPALAAIRRVNPDAVGISRSGRDGTRVADLLTGTGLDSALDGIDTIVHTATTGGARDLRMAENLTAAAVRAGVSHLVLISIVGIERIPLGFYRDRVSIEGIVERSGVPFTTQRATQFHSFVDALFSAQRFSPVVLRPEIRIQPIAVDDVAARLASLAAESPRGRVSDIGGPEVSSLAALYSTWKNATGGNRPGLGIRLPGRLFDAFDSGANLAAGEPYGRGTFAQFLAAKYRLARTGRAG